MSDAENENSQPKITRSRANGLDGSAWTRNSISIWSDLRKGTGETALRHPALFPLALPARLIECFTPPGPGLVLDPFAGSGSTPLAAWMAGKAGLGIELSAAFVALAEERYRLASGGDAARDGDKERGTFRVIAGQAQALDKYVQPNSVQLCITSPPYWNILEQKRTADGKALRDYGDACEDIGKVPSYDTFLDELEAIFSKVLIALQPGAYCCTVVMDIRKGSHFYPFHSDLTARFERCGFIYDDLIIWDRRLEYNHLRPLGYPSVFRINKVHEFIIIARKPAESRLQSPGGTPSNPI